MKYLVTALLLATSPAQAFDYSTTQQTIIVYQTFPPVIVLPDVPLATEFKPTVVTGLARPGKAGPARVICVAGCEHTGGDN